ncbi:excinuclease ABC subunit UvrC [Patescibacteria group bacterium]|nr:MAG: excinuclease ABC subunit UvrC [Patescibacteria group bacterium]
MKVTEAVKEKLKQLPKEPGVYFMKDEAGKIIYIGKAAILKNRVSSYFQTRKDRDVKTEILVGKIANLDWITVDSEVEALFLESEFIKRYMPQYNIDLRDDKHFLYIRIPMKDEWPVISFVRRPLDDGADYFGPYTGGGDAIRKAMRQLRKVFPYVTHPVSPMPKRGCLQFHLGLCPGPEENAISSSDYKRSLRRLMMYFRGEKTKLMKDLEKEMQQAAKKKDFELAGERRDQLRNLEALGRQMIFGDKETFDLTLDQALVGLSDRLGLKGMPRRMEAYDISHFQGTDNVASMVVFQDGVPNKEEYRRFKMRVPGNDDFAHMREVIRRRFSGKNLEKWPKPDLVLIDGGKGQLGAALGVMDELGIDIPAIGLAKREEEIIRRGDGSRIDPDKAGDERWVEQHVKYELIVLPHSSHVLQLLQRIRDEAHRFAVTYHSLLRGKRQTSSLLDGIPGVGPATRKLLVKRFGSVAGVKQASFEELVAAVGRSRAESISRHL